MEDLFKIKEKYLKFVTESLHSKCLTAWKWQEKHNITLPMLEKINPTQIKTTLSFGGKNVHIIIPREDCNIINWNDLDWIDNHISVKCCGVYVNLKFVRDLYNMYNKSFGGFKLKDEHVNIGGLIGTIEELGAILDEVKPVIDRIQAQPPFRDFKLELVSVFEEEERKKQKQKRKKAKK